MTKQVQQRDNGHWTTCHYTIQS